jgi:mersacidin/lichenicidin family type 2 lantibiotic
MSKSNVIRAWKDPNYRKSLTAAEQAALPANPAGVSELTDGDLEGVSGGAPQLATIVCSRVLCTVGAGCKVTIVVC